jgi:hypothetical protein
VTISDTGFL